MRKLTACLLAVCISLSVLGWTAAPAAAEVPPGFETRQETRTQTDRMPPPAKENGRPSSVGADFGVDGAQPGAVNADTGLFGKIRAWLSTRGAAAVKGAGVGLLVGGLIAAGALALGIAGAPLLLAVGAGVLGGALYGASVGNADFNWLEAGASAALSSISALTGGLAAGVGRAGASVAGRGLLGGAARGAGGAVRSGIVQPVLSAAERSGISSALRTTANLALSARDAYDAVSVLTDKEASWQDKLLAGVGALPFRRGIKTLKKTPVGIVDNAADVQRITRRKTGLKYWKHEVQFEGNRVFQRDDLIDPRKVDKDGLTNLERMKRGKAPIGPDGRPIQLHHMTQRHNGPIAEITESMHKKHFGVLHINRGEIPSGINRRAFDKWRKKYWRQRAKDFEPQ